MVNTTTNRRQDRINNKVRFLEKDTSRYLSIFFIRIMLESLVEDTQYLAVYFYKQNCHICDQILEELEKIDDECDVYGIHLVRIQDPQLAKRYSIKTFPALVYFRNGNPLLFEGDLQNEQSVLEWLIDDDNRELADEIESVNERMLNRLLNESPFLAVFFCEYYLFYYCTNFKNRHNQ